MEIRIKLINFLGWVIDRLAKDDELITINSLIERIPGKGMAFRSICIGPLDYIKIVVATSPGAIEILDDLENDLTDRRNAAIVETLNRIVENS